MWNSLSEWRSQTKRHHMLKGKRGSDVGVTRTSTLSTVTSSMCSDGSNNGPPEVRRSVRLTSLPHLFCCQLVFHAYVYTCICIPSVVHGSAGEFMEDSLRSPVGVGGYERDFILVDEKKALLMITTYHYRVMFHNSHLWFQALGDVRISCGRFVVA